LFRELGGVRIASDMTDGRPDPLNTTCANCGGAFHCGADEDACWCDAVILAREERETVISLGLEGCLCRDCLKGSLKEGT